MYHVIVFASDASGVRKHRENTEKTEKIHVHVSEELKSCAAKSLQPSTAN